MPFTAGGSSDFVASTIVAKLPDFLRTSVVVENRPGGNKVIAATTMAKAKPDGHTQLRVGELTHSSVAAFNKQLPFDPVNDFAPVTNAIASPLPIVDPHRPLRDRQGASTRARVYS